MKQFISLFFFLFICAHVNSASFVAHPIFGFLFDVDKSNYVKPEFEIPGRDRKFSWVVARYKTPEKKSIEYVIVISIIDGESGRHGDFGSFFSIIDGKVKPLGTADEAWFSNNFGLNKDIRNGLAGNAFKLALSAFGKKELVKMLHGSQGCHPIDAETKAVRSQLSKLADMNWCAPRKLYPIQKIDDPDE